MKILSVPLCNSEKNTIFERFLKHLIIDMSHIFGNMVYLNIKERDRF